MSIEDAKLANDIYQSRKQTESKRKSLSEQLDLINKDCPFQTQDEGIMMKRAMIENGYLVFVYEVDESCEDFSPFIGNTAPLKEVLANGVRDMANSELVENLKQNSLGWIVRYVGSESGKQIDVAFESLEL